MKVQGLDSVQVNTKNQQFLKESLKPHWAIRVFFQECQVAFAGQEQLDEQSKCL